jgi:hypothetical protein
MHAAETLSALPTFLEVNTSDSGAISVLYSINSSITDLIENISLVYSLQNPQLEGERVRPIPPPSSGVISLTLPQASFISLQFVTVVGNVTYRSIPHNISAEVCELMHHAITFRVLPPL